MTHRKINVTFNIDPWIYMYCTVGSQLYIHDLEDNFSGWYFHYSHCKCILISQCQYKNFKIGVWPNLRSINIIKTVQ